MSASLHQSFRLEPAVVIELDKHLSVGVDFCLTVQH